MSYGSLQNVIVCTVGAPEAAPCAAGSGPTVLQAYLIDPASAAFFEAAQHPLDTLVLGQSFLIPFTTLMILYLVSAHVGLIIKMVK